MLDPIIRILTDSREVATRWSNYHARQKSAMVSWVVLNVYWKYD